MLGARLLQLIQAHAGNLSREVMDDLRRHRAGMGSFATFQPSPL